MDEKILEDKKDVSFNGNSNSLVRIGQRKTQLVKWLIISIFLLFIFIIIFSFFFFSGNFLKSKVPLDDGLIIEGSIQNQIQDNQPQIEDPQVNIIEDNIEDPANPVEEETSVDDLDENLPEENSMDEYVCGDEVCEPEFGEDDSNCAEDCLVVQEIEICGFVFCENSNQEICKCGDVNSTPELPYCCEATNKVYNEMSNECRACILYDLPDSPSLSSPLHKGNKWLVLLVIWLLIIIGYVFWVRVKKKKNYEI